MREEQDISKGCVGLINGALFGLGIWVIAGLIYLIFIK